LTQFSPGLSEPLQQTKSYLDFQMGAFAGHTKLAMQAIYLELQRQAALLSFNDVFFLEAVILISLVGIVWIIRKPPIGGKANSPAH